MMRNIFISSALFSSINTVYCLSRNLRHANDPCLAKKDIRGITGKLNALKPFKPKGISHYYQLDKSVFVLRVVGWYVSFYSNVN